MYSHAAIEQFAIVLAFTDLADPTTSCDAPRGCVYVHVYVLSVWSEQASTVSLEFSLVTVQVRAKEKQTAFICKDLYRQLQASQYEIKIGY